MTKVYYKQMNELTESVNDVVHEMLQNMELPFTQKDCVPLKVHFGEKGNVTFIKPNYFNGIKKYLQEKNLKTCYIETNVLYKGSRTLTNDHINTAKEHGFTDLDIVIADGESENMYNEIEVNLKHFDKCKIGAKYKDYNNYIVVSHFKGHGMAGFGGAIKQLAMGFASRGGKLHQHSLSVPIIDDNCIGCGACVRKCPVNAIRIEDIAIIDEKICVGCASCTTVCPVEAISNNWETSNFHEKLAEYAYAAAKDKNNIYVQYAFNITKECDCHGDKMESIAPNIGVLISTDPVALDQATYDLLQTKPSGFETAEITLKHAENINLGSREYELIKL